MFAKVKSRATFLYDLRYILYGYLIGKFVTTQMSMCRVVGNSMSPTLQQSTSDVVLLWHGVEWRMVADTLRRWRAKVFEGTQTQRAVFVDRGAVYVVWHPTKNYKIIKRVIGLENEAIFINPVIRNLLRSESEPSTSWQIDGDVSSLWDELKQFFQRRQAPHAVVAEDLVGAVAGSERRFEQRTVQTTTLAGRTEMHQVTDVPSNHVWLEGDNQSVSEDSQMYGAVPVDNITAKAIGIVWPPSRITVLPAWDVTRRLVCA